MATEWDQAEEALRVEVAGVCRTYCLQVWNETLNQAGIEAFFAFRRAENVYYPLAIRTPSPPNSSDPQTTTVPEKANRDKGNPAKIPPSFSSPPKVAEQAKATEKEKDASKGVVPETMKPSVAPKDFSKGRESSKDLEIVIATLPIPAKEDPKGKDPASTTFEVIKLTKGTEKEKPPMKNNQGLDQNLLGFFFFFLLFFLTFVVMQTFISCNHFAFFKVQSNDSQNFYCICFMQVLTFLILYFTLNQYKSKG